MARTSARRPRHRRVDDDDDDDDDEQRGENFSRDPSPSLVFRTEGGDPICFMFHTSLRASQRRELEAKINENGGRVTDRHDKADTLIVGSELPPSDLERLQTQYACSSNSVRRKIYVERPGFIQSCISQGRFFHPLPRQRGLGIGVARYRSWRARVEYEDDEDVNLAIYIASRRPYKKMGGRCGNTLYQDLVALVPRSDNDIQEYAWAARHTWSSWRERYVRNKTKFDPLIKQIVRSFPPDERANPRDKWFRRTSFEDESQDENVDELDDDDEIIQSRTQGRRQRRASRSSTDHQHATSRQRDKGKRKASPLPSHEEFEIEENSDYDPLFDGDFSMSENVFGDQSPPPRPTQVSQRTLVGTPSNKMTQASVDRGSRAGPSQPPIRSGTKVVSAAPDRAPSAITHSRPQKSGIAQVRKVEVKKEKQSLTKPVATANKLPSYPNTRSRSQSLEPFLSLTNTGSRSRKNKPSSALPAIQDVIEISDDDTSMPAAETMNEEQSVLEHLFDVEHSMTMHEEQKNNVEFDVEGSQAQRARESGEPGRLDSDDQQTHDALNEASGIADDEDDIFGPRDAAPATAQMRSRLRSGVSRVQRDTQVAVNTPKLVPPGRGPGRRTAQPLVTPAHRQKERQATEAVFPSPGTRAYKVKRHLETKEKSTVYVPPAGTRAAALKH